MVRSNVVYTTDDKLTATVSRSSTSVFVSASLRKAPAPLVLQVTCQPRDMNVISYDVIIYLHCLGVGLR